MLQRSSWRNATAAAWKGPSVLVFDEVAEFGVLVADRFVQGHGFGQNPKSLTHLVRSEVGLRRDFLD
jgi:hypothetical protein